MATEMNELLALAKPRRRLEGISTSELANEVGAAGWPRQLVTGILHRGTQYACAAPPKTGKTLDALDLAISIAAGVPYLGRFETEQAPVLIYASELTQRAYLRFADAIARAKGLKGLHELGDLIVNFHPPQLASKDDLREVAREVRMHGAALLIIDPYYRSAAGISGSQLSEAGAALGALTDALFDLDCAQMITHHTTKSAAAGDGLAAFSGVGLQHWARTAVVLSASGSTGRDREGFAVRKVVYRFDGSDEGPLAFTVTRHLRKDGPGPSAHMDYRVEVTDHSEFPVESGGDGMSPRMRRTLAALTDAWSSGPSLQQLVAEDGQGLPLKTNTVMKAAEELVEAGFAERTGGVRGSPRMYRRSLIEDPPESEASWIPGGIPSPPGESNLLPAFDSRKSNYFQLSNLSCETEE